MNENKMDLIFTFIRSLYPDEAPVPLHAPRFFGNEKKYLAKCIDTTYVSYVGEFVSSFEEHIVHLTGAKNAIAMVNGTAALQIALMAAGVAPGDEVITQALTFVATTAAIKHAQAEPAFIDVDRDTIGMSPDSLSEYLETNCRSEGRSTVDKRTGRRIAAIVPMHTFGHPTKIESICAIADKYGIQVIEDSAESIGSYYKGKHTGTFGRAGIFSFNGNKPITTGGGGMIISDDDAFAERARHISTTAKMKHPWEFFHDEVGYNLRLPNVNAAIGCAQMEYFESTLANKRETASRYARFFASEGIGFLSEPADSRSNYWLNAIILKDRDEREDFLKKSNGAGIQTRPVWTLMTKLPPYRECMRSEVSNAEWLEDRIVNIPSSVRK
jgi:aminotransferase in exopolysaccharide biosynthesis